MFAEVVLQPRDEPGPLPVLCLPHQRPGPGAGGRHHGRGGDLPRHGAALTVSGVHLSSLWVTGTFGGDFALFGLQIPCH